MTFYPNFYEILKVPEDLPVEEIKAAFRKLALIHHPDKNNNSPESQAHFILLFNAYTVLTDPAKRKEYDTYLGTSYFFRSRKKTAGKKAALPGKAGDSYRSNEELLSHFNVLLWDIEDIIRNMGKQNRSRGDNQRFLEKYILTILAFIDKWVLHTAGYPDYFMEARKMNRIDPVKYVNTIDFHQGASGHRPFISMTGYFYDIRKRMDRFLGNTTINDLVKTIPGYDLRLIDCIIEAQNYTIHYLSSLPQIQTGVSKAIPPFTHSNACFSENS